MPNMTESEVLDSFAQIGGPMLAFMGFRMKCAPYGQEITLRSGEELNREWVREYYDKEYRPQSEASVSVTAVH